MDVDSEAVAYGREHFAEDGLSFEHGDVEQLSFIDKFDVITCFETIEHVKDDARGLANLHRALRTGGLLLLSTPNRLITSPRADSILDRPENPFHVREYVQAELLNVISKVGFSIIAVKGQRFRTWFPSGTANMLLDRLRALRHFNPDRDSSEAVRSDHLMWKQPRILIVVATKP
jgi:2-polyprenyl-3-methyl-5-hydroxy-6-metoxy-1,4-benzoquinol methylase